MRTGHHVAHFEDALGDPLAAQVLHRRGRGAKEKLRDVVHGDAVNLFRHGAVEAAQSRLHVRHGQVQLGRRQPSRQCGVGVAVHQHAAGFVLHQYGFDAHQHHARLHGVRARAGVEIQVGFGNIELAEKYSGEAVVIMLAGVDENLFVALPQHAAHRRRLDELGTRADDGDDLHAFAPWA